MRQRRKAYIARNFERGKPRKPKLFFRVGEFQTEHIFVERFARVFFKEITKSRITVRREFYYFVGRKLVSVRSVQFVEQIFKPLRVCLGLRITLFEKHLQKQIEYKFRVENVA